MICPTTHVATDKENDFDLTLHRVKCNISAAFSERHFPDGRRQKSMLISCINKAQNFHC